MKTLDNPLYYLDNFRHALDWVRARYDDLLDDGERGFVDAFSALPQPSQSLFVRMVMRRGELFRASRLRYEEVGCPRTAAAPLIALGWVDAEPLLDVDDLFRLLTRPELEDAFRGMEGIRQQRKDAWLARMREAAPAPRPLRDWHPASDDAVLALRAGDIADRLRLLYFGNLHQDWSDFVVSQLGILRYETVPFSPESRGFRVRADIDDYLALFRCRERLDAEEALATVLPDILAIAPRSDRIAERRGSLLYRIAYALEQAGELEPALALYRESRAEGARQRIVRTLEKLERHEEAHALAVEAAAAPEDEAERQQLARCLPRLRRKLGLPKLPPAATDPAAATPRIDLVLPRPADGLPVEFAARDHLATPEVPVFYVENTLVNALFGLLCWPAIFAPLPGAFFHPFQAGPADLHRPDFRSRRAAEFAACLGRLDDGSYREAILAAWRDKHGLQSPFVAWDYLDEGLLRLALDCIPADHLRSWFERILADVRANRSGFPDLIAFDPAARRYRMIEVKGPGDRLQDNQLRFLAHCLEHGMPVATCWVRWEDEA